MPGPSIAQIKEHVAERAIETGHPETLMHFLQELPGSMEAQQFYGLLIAGAAGITAHYLLKYLYGEPVFHRRFKRIVASWLLFVGSCAVLVGADTFTGQNGGFTGWFSVMVQGFTAGLGIDALANKGSKEIWTDEMRAARLAKDKAKS